MIVDPNTLHCDQPNPHIWSRANFEEAMPGVLTPLSWSFWGVSSEASSKRIYTAKLGVFASDELTDSLADSTAVLFWGRAAVNVDLLYRVMNRLPGADPAAMEAQILGQSGGGNRGRRTWRRAPFVIACAPVNVVLGPRRLRALRVETDRWWRESTAVSPRSVADAGAMLLEARRRFTDVTTEHGFNVFVGQVGFDCLAQLSSRAGHPGLELALSAGTGTEETAMVDDLWSAASGRISVDAVVERHGYHGPVEGEMSSYSWREDRSPLLHLLDRYRLSGGPPSSGAALDRAAAAALLLAGLGGIARMQARAVMRFVDLYLPLREVGKTSMLQCIDVGRHAAHAAGRMLVADGLLNDPDDIRFVTVEEIVTGEVGPVAARRARREELLDLELPDTWTGVPSSWPRTSGTVSGGPVIQGVPASPGRYKGVARLVARPDDCDALEPGDVIVCELTDPGWAPLFSLAGALVIDIGGPLSHGAIVAREMGIPCVIGTGDGTRRITDGAVVDVDGDAGSVTMC